MDALSRAPCDHASDGESEQNLVAAVQSSPQSPAKGSLESCQHEDPTLAPYFAHLEEGVLPDNEALASELVLTKGQSEIVDGYFTPC